jgi:uncharacterized protein YkwD
MCISLRPKLSLLTRLSWLGVFLGAVAFTRPVTALALGGATPATSAADLGSPEAARAPPAVPDPIEAELFALVNADRSAGGVAPVAFDTEVLDIARARAVAQVPLPHLSHYDSSGQPAVAGMLVAAGAYHLGAGENLVRLPGSDSTVARRAEEALMNSPSHRAITLEPRFNRLAVGAIADGNGCVIFAEVFRAAAPDQPLFP